MPTWGASVGQNASSAQPAGTLTTRSPKAWIESASDLERRIISDDGSTPLRYRVHKVDSKGDTVRVQIETRQGAVARLVEKNGQPLTALEDEAEQQRLRDILAAPDAFVRHHKRDESTRQDTLGLVKLMPQAMIYAYTPGQPQLPDRTGGQVVLDFQPDPEFHPPTMASEMLTGLAGRLWIDPHSGRMMRVEAHVLRPVSFGWGIVGKIYPGGTILLDQANAAGDRWVYSDLSLRLSMRVVIKSVAMDDRMTASDFAPLPAPLNVDQAVQQLLAMHVPTR